MGRPRFAAEALTEVDYTGLEQVLTAPSEPRGAMALARLVELLVELDRRGSVDPIIGILQDEETFGAIVGLLASDEFPDSWSTRRRS